MQTGILTVTGKGKTELSLRRRPRGILVWFKPVNDPVPCNHHHHHHHHGKRDFLSYKVTHEDDRRHRKFGRHHHHYHERKFFLNIKWNVDGIREIFWFVFY